MKHSTAKALARKYLDSNDLFTLGVLIASYGHDIEISVERFDRGTHIGMGKGHHFSGASIVSVGYRDGVLSRIERLDFDGFYDGESQNMETVTPI